MRTHQQASKPNRHGFSITFPKDNGTNLSDLIGLEDQVKEVQNVVTYIKNKSAFDKIGVFPCTKIVLAGPVGCGKASLAYAVAKETDTPIFTINATSFMILDTSLKRLKTLFSQIMKFPKSILLIKDMEYLSGFEVEDSLHFFEYFFNLLEKAKNTIVFITISSTIVKFPAYFVEEGRFEKVITFDYPEQKSREMLFQKFFSLYHTKLVTNLDLTRLSRSTYGMTGGNIKKIVYNAMLLATSDGRDTLHFEDLDNIISNITLGEKKKKLTEKEKLSTAYHEIGHVLAGFYSRSDFKLSKVEIVPRTESLGTTCYYINEENFTVFKEQFEGYIITSFGGMVAENIIYGSNSSSVGQDLLIATSIATQMIKLYGMDDVVGPVSCHDDDEVSVEFYNLIYTQAQKLLKSLYQKCTDILLAHIEELKVLAQKLYEAESLSGAEIKALLDEFKK